MIKFTSFFSIFLTVAFLNVPMCSAADVAADDDEEETAAPAATPKPASQSAVTTTTVSTPLAPSATDVQNAVSSAAPLTEREEKMAVLRRLATAVTDKWDQVALDAAIGGGLDEKLEAIAKNKKLTPAMKAVQKSAAIKSQEKRKARYKQLLVQNKIDFPKLCLESAVDALDTTLNWTIVEYRELDGLVKLVNKTKTAFPPFETGKAAEAKWKVWGEQMQVKVTPIITKFAAAISPVTAQIEMDEKNHKF